MMIMMLSAITVDIDINNRLTPPSLIIIID